MNKRPNIITIIADDMGYGDLSCYGAEKYRTPNMDRMAQEGLRFNDMHSSSAVCTPSRYSILTGRYCWRTRLKKGVLGGFGAPLIESDRPTVPNMLFKHGYRTKAVGKWHLGLGWKDLKGNPLSDTDVEGWNIDGDQVDYARGFTGGPCDLGFEEFYGISGSLDMPPYCFLKDNKPETIPDMEKTYYYPQQRKGMMSKGWDDKHVDMKFTEKAVEYINERGKEKDTPFYLHLTPTSPHRPCVPPDQFRGKSNAGMRGDMVLVVDYMVGAVMDSLAENGLKDNTLVIVSSDNGARVLNYDGKDYGHKANGDLRGQKGDIYEGGHREPCLAMWPNVIKARSESDELLSLVDIFATIADVLDEEGFSDSAVDSRSFLPVLLGDSYKEPIHEAVIHHALDGLFSVRKGPWKAIFGLGSGGFSEPARYDNNHEGPEGQLYNIEDDSRETKNVWKEYPEVVQELKDYLYSSRIVTI
jgi:arylsulfatase A-like enzyme